MWDTTKLDISITFILQLAYEYTVSYVPLNKIIISIANNFMLFLRLINIKHTHIVIYVCVCVCMCVYVTGFAKPSLLAQRTIQIQFLWLNIKATL